MAAGINTCTKEEQRSVICFLISEGVKPIEVHRHLKVRYGDACLSQQQMYEWSRKFRNGVTSVADAPHPGQVHRVVTVVTVVTPEAPEPPESVAAVEALAMENRQVSVDEIAEILNMNHGSAHHVIHDVLQFHKVSASWVPQQLTPELKQQCVDTCKELLRRLEAEGGGFLLRIATGDETWVHCHQPQTENKQGMASFLITKIQEVPNHINAVLLSIRTSKYECIFLITAADQLSKCNGSKLKFLIYLCRLAR
ncbi:uncharacterized protein LOC111869483 [Cryptotermes secundus]|uniref:uncharacterized protein LOC111869483 n=1 Tax=Cryptotermes secundus TaxID=105785 RepID=UPI000CD7C5E0|nr:uncharacterized protein LOC111869483 [Cryptotermes secundus]